MLLSTFRSGVAAIVAAAILAACGGHGVVPSQTFANGNGVAAGSDALLNVIPNKTSKCDIPGIYYFHGDCVAFTLNMNSNSTVELGKYGAYHGIKITSTFGIFENPPKGVKSVPAIMGDATGDGDITGQVGGKNFPLYGNGKDCVNSQGKPEFCPGKPFVYAELINTSKYTLKPKYTPKFYITDSNKFPGTRLCFPAILTAKGAHTAGGWAPNTTLGGQPHGTTLTINAQPNPGQLIYPPGPFIVAGACE